MEMVARQGFAMDGVHEKDERGKEEEKGVGASASHFPLILGMMGAGHESSSLDLLK